MNLLEHYIEEIHSEELVKDLVVAIVTADCYGRRSRVEHVTTPEKWEEEKKQGYFLA